MFFLLLIVVLKEKPQTLGTTYLLVPWLGCVILRGGLGPVWDGLTTARARQLFMLAVLLYSVSTTLVSQCK